MPLFRYVCERRPIVNNKPTNVRMRTFTFPILHRPLGCGNQHIFFLDISIDQNAPEPETFSLSETHPKTYLKNKTHCVTPLCSYGKPPP